MVSNLQVDPSSGFATGLVSPDNVAYNNFAQVPRVCCHHAFPTQQHCELGTGLDSWSAGVDTFDVLQPATIYSVDGSTLTLRFFWGTAGFADGSPLAFNVTGYDSNANQVERLTCCE